MMAVKNPNSFKQRIIRFLLSRWSEKDTPTSEARFQPTLFAKDLAIFILLPLVTVFLFKACESAMSVKPQNKRKEINQNNQDYKFENLKSQIIEFRNLKAKTNYGFGKRSTGTLVKLKLLNVVETYGNAPVHAQVMDTSLGKQWIGATLIGDAEGDTNFDRITISFNRIKSSGNLGLSSVIKARALSLNGSLGIEARKKEGFFARSAMNSANPAANSAQSSIDSMNLNQVLAKALATGLLQEFSTSTTVEKNRSQVLTLSPGEIFFAELTDEFPQASGGQ